MSEEIFVTCFEQELSDEFMKYVSEQGLGCTRLMALNAAAYNLTQLTVYGPTVAGVAIAIYNFIKNRKIEVTIELTLESKTTTIGKKSSQKELENFVEQNRSQQFIIKTKI